MIADHSIRVNADRGGTFTDVHASWPSGAADAVDGRREIVVKLLSSDPSNYKDAPVEGVRRVLEIATGESYPRGVPIDPRKLESVRLSTTVATNALLERKGQRTALVITQGFEDLLEIGNQARPRIFDLDIKKAPNLYEAVVGVKERVTLVGYTTDPLAAERAVKFADDGSVISGYEGSEKVVRGLSGEAVKILQEPDLDALRPKLEALYAEGFRSLAVVFIHSYTFPDHELQVGKLARVIGFEQVSLSSQLLPMIKAVPRGQSTLVDAYLTPILNDYLKGFFAGFAKEPDGQSLKVEFMGSDGGLLSLNNFSGLKSLLSGPAGGVVGYALTAFAPEMDDPPPLIGFDIGGTSTDVSRYAGRYEKVYETTTAGVSIQSPQLDINTVAAGGGSCLTFERGLFRAGPESAGAHPGPACYRKGGPLALTDANLVLGRILPEFFPKVFGPRENEALDPQASLDAFQALEERIRAESAFEGSIDELVYGFVTVANETMARPIRTLTESRGFDLAKHILCAFGGAGGQHACEVAQSLGISRIIIHRYSSILSAYGLALADRVHEAQEPFAVDYSEESLPGLLKRLDDLEASVRKELTSQGFRDDKGEITVERFLNMRYLGTDTLIQTQQPADSTDFAAVFEREYRDEFGFVLANRVTVDDVRCRGTGKTYSSLPPSPLTEFAESTYTPVDVSAASKSVTSIYFPTTGRVDVPVFRLEDLKTGEKVEGPAALLDATQTILIVPRATAFVTSTSLLIELDSI